MARMTGADCKLCRREGCKLFLKGERCLSSKCPMEHNPTIPGQHGAAKKKVTEYGKQLREKQKVKRAYGVLEKQFRSYYEEAERQKGVTGTVMLRLLETRLDNVVYRMGIGSSRKEARQIVNHGHITVNGRCVNIPSYQVKVNDVIAIKESKVEKFKHLKELKVVTPKWLEFSVDTLSGKINALPEREDIDLTIAEHLIIELYSK